jgi:L-alanine-DL-glutamate epimerase-like enolase superfamily enzyme
MTDQCSGPSVSSLAVSCYTVPTTLPESDGTLKWDKTTMVLVEIEAGGSKAFGYSYADVATGQLIETLLKKIVEGRNAFDIPGAHSAMRKHVRNLGGPGISAMAISAVDNALWDLKAKLLGISLLDLLGAATDAVPIYGSGGFTSYTHEELEKQLGGWAEQGLHAVKMKIGREPDKDVERVRIARKAIGKKVDLYVDANGAYSRKQALDQAEKFILIGVHWFEEPVSADDLEGLRLVRDRCPGGMDIAAGEYGYDSYYFRRMLDAEAVDVLQADATRCGGITGFLEAAALCGSHGLPFSFHCAPALHAAPACAIPFFKTGEYFFDHARIEKMFFDGVPEPVDGKLKPDRSRPGFGFDLKRKEMERYAV